ncbi:MAG TPA: general secretion pathway protein GspG [Thermoanaerobaculia bacterium]|nr:general secretion pathway protein GspG [Thermoanaerobaculia bacterium]HUM31292.1 general secretion pathway protein GspG [Thermoanaerobaculia bacterium]
MVCALIAILSAMAVPIAKFSIQRHKEIELRYQLRKMRTAIDEYKKLWDQFHFPVEIGSEGYPETLEKLVEGVEINMKTYKFLRRIPVDPMTGEAEWGMRSLQDDFDSDSWGGENVYDVYSLSGSKALDGSYYHEW